MNVKLKPRTNGQTNKPQWEIDDAEDKLAEKLAEVNQDDIPLLPAKPQPAPVAPAPPARPKETVNVKQLMETLLEAWTNPTVRMWASGSELCFEQVDESARTKNTWRVGFSHVRTDSVRLIK